MQRFYLDTVRLVAILITLPTFVLSQERAPFDGDLSNGAQSIWDSPFQQEQMQLTQRDLINQQVRQSQSQMLLTRDGRVVFQFPNYDISVGGVPEFAGQGNGTSQRQDVSGSRDSTATRIIWKSDQGSSWDGSSFFRSRNYNDSYAANYYTRGILGQPGEQWTAQKIENDNQACGTYRNTPGSLRRNPSTEVLYSAKSPATIRQLYSASIPKFLGSWKPLESYGQFGQTKEAPKAENTKTKIEFDEMAANQVKTQAAETNENETFAKHRRTDAAQPFVLTRRHNANSQSKRMDTRAVNDLYLESLKSAADSSPSK